MPIASSYLPDNFSNKTNDSSYNFSPLLGMVVNWPTIKNSLNNNFKPKTIILNDSNETLLLNVTNTTKSSQITDLLKSMNSYETLEYYVDLDSKLFIQTGQLKETDLYSPLNFENKNQVFSEDDLKLKVDLKEDEHRNLNFEVYFEKEDALIKGLNSFCEIRENSTGNWNKNYFLVEKESYTYQLKLISKTMYEINCFDEIEDKQISTIGIYSPKQPAITYSETNLSLPNITGEVVVEDLYVNLTNNSFKTSPNDSIKNEFNLMYNFDGEDVDLRVNYVSLDGEPLVGLNTFCELRENSTGNWSSPYFLFYDSQLKKYQTIIPTKNTFLAQISCFTNLKNGENKSIIKEIKIQSTKIKQIPLLKELKGFTTEKNFNAQTKKGLFSLKIDKGKITKLNVDSKKLSFKLENLSDNDHEINLTLPQPISKNKYLYIWKEKKGKYEQIDYDFLNDRSNLKLKIKKEFLDSNGNFEGIIFDPLTFTFVGESTEVTTTSSQSALIALETEKLDVKTNKGVLGGVLMVDPHNLPDTPVPPRSFDLNLLKLNISDFEGEGVAVTFQTDKPLRKPTVWKFNPQTYKWYTMPFVKIDERTIQITIIDGGLGDDDGIKNGIIIDDVGISQDNTWLYIGDDSDTGTAYAYQDHYFYANYSDNTTKNPIADGNCSIKENSTGSWNINPMTYNVTSKLHEFTTSFTNVGVHEYNISCDSLTYTNISLAEEFTVSTNTFPTLSNFVLRTKGDTNCTEDNLQMNFTLNDAEGDDYYTTVDWKENGSSIARVHFDFNENITSTATDGLPDLGTYGNNGKLGAGNAAKVPLWQSNCVSGGCYDFDGVDDFIYVYPSETYGSFSEFTLEYWVYFDNETQDYLAPILSVDSRYVSRVRTVSNQIELSSVFYPGGTLEEVKTGTTQRLSPNQWYNVVTVYNGSLISLYINGNLIDTQTGSGNISTIGGEGMYIGGYSTTVTNASVDEISIIDRAFTWDQVNISYQEGLLGKTSNYLDDSMTRVGDNWSAKLYTQENSRQTNDSNYITITCYNDNPPVFENSIPVNNLSNYSTLSTINFSCNFTDDYGLTNISLKLSNSSNGDWHFNQSTSVSGTQASVWWEVNLTNGFYSWACFANDGSNQTTISSNKTINLSLDSQSPIINSIIFDPENLYFNTVFKIKSNVTDNNEVENVTVEFNGTNYSMSLVNGLYEKEFDASSYGGGTYNVTVYANDTWTNADSDNTSLEISSKYDSLVNFTINNQQTNLSVGFGELININATLVYPSSLIELQLYRNGTSLVNNSNNISYSESFSSPNVYNYTIIFPGNATVQPFNKTILVNVSYTQNLNVVFTGLTPDNGTVQNSSVVPVQYTVSTTLDSSSFITVDDDLLGYWNFENDVGSTVVDWSNNNLNGVMYGATPKHGGIRGNYLEFAGAGGVNLSSVFLNLTRGFTVDAWVYGGTQTGKSPLFISNATYPFGLEYNILNTKFELYYKTNDSSYYASGIPGTPLNGRWHHVLGYFDGNNRIKLFIDSNNVKELVVSGSMTPETALLTMARSSEGYFNGSLDDIQLWNRVLTDSEINNLYNNTGSGSKTFTLDEGIHTIRACVSDKEGQILCESRTVTVDTQYPVLSLNRTGDEIYNRTLDLPLKVVVDDDSIQTVNATVFWNNSYNSQTISLIEVNGVYQGNFTQTNRLDNFNITYSAQDGIGRVINLTEIITTSPLNGDAIYINFKGQTTDFNALSDNGDVSNALLEIPNVARIQWHNNINTTSQDFDSNVNISKGLISVDSTVLHSSINSSATLTFYGGNWLEPLIYKNGELCTSCDLNYYDGENISFNITSFSSYTVVDATNLTIWDESDSRFVFNSTNNTFYANYTNTTSGVPITGADVECNFTENSAGTWSTPATMSYINSLYQINKTFANNGTYQFNVSCVNNQGYANLTVTDDFMIYPDMVTELTILNATMNISNPKEGANVLLSVNISNLGELNGTNFTLNLNVSLYNGTKIFTYSNETLVNLLEAGTTKIINFTWIATTGTTIFDLYVDSYNNITEVDETNNTYLINTTVDSWSVFYGNLSTTLVLGDSNNETLFDWASTPFGWMLISDVDSSYVVDNLEPLTSNNLIDLDNALNMTGFNDSIKNMYDANDNGVSDIFMNITLFGRNITNIPARKLDPSSDFLTGILFDTADGASFTGNEDVVFIVAINESAQGTYSTSDYEIVFPAALRKYKGSVDQVLYQLEFD